MIELIITHNNVPYQPITEDGIQWETNLKGQPSRLSFTVIKDGILNFQEGDQVSLKLDEKKVFLGYVFTKKRNKDGGINVTAYDQLRYFKNNDFYKLDNITASDFLIRETKLHDFNLGIIEDTGYIIKRKIENGKSLVEAVQNALDDTLYNTGETFILYDEYGKITLKNWKSMRLTRVIDQDTAENFDYSSSIDSDTYNRIKLVNLSEDGDSINKTLVNEDSDNVGRWGLLQYYEEVDQPDNMDYQAKMLLRLYNKKKRTLSVSNAFGDINVRAGSSLPALLNLGDVEVKNYMVVEKAVHTFKEKEHTMNLTLKGGVINA